MIKLENLRNLRLAAHEKQEIMALKIGVTAQTYCKWENFRSEPNATQLYTISKILGVKIENLFNSEIEETENKKNMRKSLMNLHIIMNKME